MTTPSRKIEYIRLSELLADPRNPKAHKEEIIDQSIGRFGVLDIIVRDERTGYIISGHGRRKAFTTMKDRGDNPPEGIRTDKDGEWLVPVVTGWASRSDQEASAALIALNRTTELGGWADDSLLELLEDLEDSENGFLGIGFDEHDLDSLRANLEEMEGEEAWEDFIHGDGTASTKNQAEYLEEYDHRARRMLVLDYSVEEFREVVARLSQIREDLGVDNNPEAIRLLVEKACPDLPEDFDADEEESYESEDEYKDPAATLGDPENE